MIALTILYEEGKLCNTRQVLQSCVTSFPRCPKISGQYSHSHSIRVPHDRLKTAHISVLATLIAEPLTQLCKWTTLKKKTWSPGFAATRSENIRTGFW